MSNANTDIPWRQTGAVEEALLNASQGNPDAELQVLEIFRQVPEGALRSAGAEILQTWLSGMEFLLEEWVGQPCSATRRELLLEAARTGIDNALLRDLLATEARRRFTEYLDPAGMINALGIVKQEVSVVDIHRRWQMFELVSKGHWCVHAIHGTGKIVDVDDLANEVSVRFGKKISFSTSAFLESMVLIRPGTTLAKICTGEISGDAALAAVDGDHAALGKQLAAPAGLEDAALKLLVGNTAGKKRPAKAAVKQSKNEHGDRRWDEARSLHELLEILRSVQQIDIRDASTETVGQILLDAAARKDYATNFAEAVARLWNLSPQTEWLEKMLAQMRQETWPWQNTDHFAGVTDDIAGRLLPHWLAASRETLGAETLAEYTARLPLRIWTQVEKTLQNTDGANELLVTAAVHAIHADPPSPDAAVWLWKSKRPERSELADASLIFRLLSIPVTGAYIKASKQLRKLLLEDETFQKFLLRDGDGTAVSALVQCARGLSVLNSGETQSLLVRIVRLFPETKPLVEKRDRKRIAKAMPKTTSFRSCEMYRKELKDIINVRIPENSRAIAHARSYGDLRENAEYKAAKEEQAYLSARRNELEEGLDDIQATDFAHVEPQGRVVPGSTVVLGYPDGACKTFHVMGLWDSDPNAGILSYDTPLGRLLLGTAADDEVTIPTGETVTVKSVKPLSDEMLQWALGEE